MALLFNCEESGHAALIRFTSLRIFFKNRSWQDKQLPVMQTFASPVRWSSYLSGIRVGEAANPGPSQCSKDSIQLSILNPTALHGRTSDVLALGSDVVFVSESSATDYAQKILSREYQKASFKTFWSSPAPDKFATDDGRP